MAVTRTCFACGRTYEFCGQNCKGEDASETWRFLFDNKNCLHAYELWQSYRGKEITKEEYKNSLNNMNLKDILASDTMVSKDFNSILNEDMTAKMPEKDIKKDEGKEVEKPGTEEENHNLSVSEELKKNENKKFGSKAKIKYEDVKK